MFLDAVVRKGRRPDPTQCHHRHLLLHMEQVGVEQQELILYGQLVDIRALLPQIPSVWNVSTNGNSTEAFAVCYWEFL